MKFFIPIFLIIISAVVSSVLVIPKYESIQTLLLEKSAYEKAFENGKLLEQERDKLVKKYNDINPADLEKLNKFLPNSIDNIRIILEIQKIANAYGMELKNIKYDDKKTQEDLENPNVVQSGIASVDANSSYGTWNLEFTTEGSYNSFLSLVKGIERNLRLIDIVSIDFLSSNTSSKKSDSDNYAYNFKIKTYWLKSNE